MQGSFYGLCLLKNVKLKINDDIGFIIDWAVNFKTPNAGSFSVDRVAIKRLLPSLII